ncbi:hypothetical protein ACHQM5_021445 [Ranunculus cassubicifolius]
MASLSWVSPVFDTKPNLYKQNPKPKTKNFIEFSNNSRSNIVSVSTENGKKKRYGGSLPSILRALDTEDEIDKAMNLWVGKLSPKEQTVILKEQRDWSRVLRVFRWMKSQTDYIPNVIHYNVVLRVLGRAQKWDELRLCWIEMAKDGVFFP